MRRSHLSPNKDRKVFKRTSRVHKSNTIKFVMRGGIRK
ncbi:MAG: hypothetical protein [Microvirus sp.]|nr:MAG: hypothetical protein [Microvirus sp.]